MAATMRATRIGERDFQWGSRTFVMGIVNVTPDSFSGDGVMDVEGATAQAIQMEQDGADLIDIGAESTRPETWSGAGLPAEEEMARVLPVVERVAAAVNVPVSIDTYKAAVAERAIAAGARLVNDVWGLKRDPAMAATVARLGVPVVLMHNNPGGGYADLIGEIAAWLGESVARARAAGVHDERIILDPGIGFGKTREENLEIIRRLPDFRSLGYPLLIGPSRKSFIGKTLDLPVDDRFEGTAAAVALSIAGGADIVRVHDVGAMVRVARMADAIIGRASPVVSNVLLALGSNVGDRDGYLAAARAALAESGIRIIRESRVAETEPVGVTDQPRFLNQVLEADTVLEPRALLTTVKGIEQRLGRQPRPRWHPREIDIDILRYDDRIVDEPGLHVPHPELKNRPFLLDLIAELEVR